MNAREYWLVFRKRWRMLVVFFVLGVASSIEWTVSLTPQYAAGTELFVSVRQLNGVADLYQGGNFSRERVKSYARVVTSSQVLQPVVDQLKLPGGPDDLARKVTVDAPIDTVLINITVRDQNPRTAAALANAIGASTARVIPALEPGPTNQGSMVNISTIRQAEPATSPVSPNVPLNIAIGALSGALIGLSIAVARHALDTRIHHEEDVKRISDEAILGAVPLTSRVGRGTPVIAFNQRDGYAEAFRTLRTNLQFVDAAEQIRSLAVMSAAKGEGKTTVAVNLALALTHAGVKVALVDADLRCPQIAKYLGLVGDVGLTTVLLGRSELKDSLQSWAGTTLRVLASGECPPNPSELLGTSAMATIISDLEKTFDVVIVDTPPLLHVADAVALSNRVSGCLVVVGVKKVRRDGLARALEGMRVVGARVVGLALNRLPRKGADSSTGYGYYYTSDPDGHSKRTPWRRSKSTATLSEREVLLPRQHENAGVPEDNGHHGWARL